MALAYHLTDGLLVALLLALMSAPVLLVSHLIARHRRQLGDLSWQLAIGVVAVLGLDLLGVQAVATAVACAARGLGAGPHAHLLRGVGRISDDARSLRSLRPR